MRIKLYLYLLLTIVTNALLAPGISAQTPEAKILLMGDSLSAGYGMQLEQAWPSLLQQKLKQDSHWQLINASVSGETSSGGKARLTALLKEHQPAIVILELGGNDGLRGQPLKLLRTNLQVMIDASKASGAQVVLVGMQIPPNYGARYTKEFAQTYSNLAQTNQLPLVPFLLQGVATHPELMQKDGIHAAPIAQAQLLNNVWPVLEPLLQAHQAGSK